MAQVKLDALDRKILAALQQNGRITNQELSEAVGLSPSPCLRRLRRLEESGVISGYVALVDPGKVDQAVSAFVRVRLDQQDDGHLTAFEKAVAQFPEIMECYLMTGDCDYQLRVLSRSLESFEDFLRSKLTKIPGVSGVTTSFALRPVVYNTRVPLEIDG
ncbi:Lrp/AsnC family transcriptional regulator [Novosphingobium sp. 9U]|uniref:Lrp/AsnC family transcriptional regulator n=1 Tax=Novosphingobium sp. 9U TaxID=2653158 RepID=UPI0012F2C294|nr:Lrp/AsnC family transcriptional regulator [Novosphingobium sp. 9U]VWX50084.1 Bkd operon transcriptional regulator [Novosphingobium sp. 9U]